MKYILFHGPEGTRTHIAISEDEVRFLGALVTLEMESGTLEEWNSFEDYKILELVKE